MRIDFTRGGYDGDPVENHYRWFTTRHMDFWWHFREVLRAAPSASPHLRKRDGTTPSSDEQRDFVAISLLNYAVYTGMAEALAFLDQLECALSSKAAFPTSGSLFSSSAATGTASAAESEHMVDESDELYGGLQTFQVLRSWKAAYSSLYTSFNALCNIVCVVVGHRPILKKTKPPVRNYGLRDALVVVKEGPLSKHLVNPLTQCSNRLEIRHHLDHYWTIWHYVGRNVFRIDANFTKGHIVLDPNTEVSGMLDARKRLQDDIRSSADDFNLVYQHLAVKDGFLDQYLLARHLKIDYSDNGPHDGERPLP